MAPLDVSPTSIIGSGSEASLSPQSNFHINNIEPIIIGQGKVQAVSPFGFGSSPECHIQNPGFGIIHEHSKSLDESGVDHHTTPGKDSFASRNDDLEPSWSPLSFLTEHDYPLPNQFLHQDRQSSSCLREQQDATSDSRSSTLHELHSQPNATTIEELFNDKIFNESDDEGIGSDHTTADPQREENVRKQNNQMLLIDRSAFPVTFGPFGIHTDGTEPIVSLSPDNNGKGTDSCQQDIGGSSGVSTTRYRKRGNEGNYRRPNDPSAPSRIPRQLSAMIPSDRKLFNKTELSNSNHDEKSSSKNSPPLLAVSGGAVSLKMGLVGLDTDHTHLPQPLPEFSPANSSSSFKPSKVRFSDMHAPSSTYEYEPFDWDDFDEEEKYGPLPDFDYYHDVLRGSVEMDLWECINVIVSPDNRPLRPIIRQSNTTPVELLNEVEILGVPLSRRRDSTGFGYSQSFDVNRIAGSPVPPSFGNQQSLEAGVILTRKNEEAANDTPEPDVKGGLRLTLSFFN